MGCSITVNPVKTVKHYCRENTVATDIKLLFFWSNDEDLIVISHTVLCIYSSIVGLAKFMLLLRSVHASRACQGPTRQRQLAGSCAYIRASCDLYIASTYLAMYVASSPGLGRVHCTRLDPTRISSNQSCNMAGRPDARCVDIQIDIFFLLDRSELIKPHACMGADTYVLHVLYRLLLAAKERKERRGKLARRVRRFPIDACMDRTTVTVLLRINVHVYICMLHAERASLLIIVRARARRPARSVRSTRMFVSTHAVRASVTIDLQCRWYVRAYVQAIGRAKS